MSKKKAIKLAAASAVAASAFVAAAPAQTDAASNVAVEVSKAVTQMKKAYHTYSDVTAQGKFAPIADVYKEYNAAKKAYANAKALVTKTGGEQKEAYLAQLEVTYDDFIAKRVVTYIDAFNYAKTLEAKELALETALEEGNWDEAEKQYHDISYELKTRTVILDRVYGKTTRELLRGSFKADAQAARDSIVNEVSVKMYYDKAEALLDEGKLEEAKAAMDKVAEFVEKLDADTDFGAALLEKVEAAQEKFEELSVPKVESVSAINTKTLKVQFSKSVDSTKATFAVKKGTSTIGVTEANWNADKTAVELVINSKLSEGTYNVTVSGLTETALTSSVAVQNEKVTEIKFLSDKLIKTANSGTEESPVYNAVVGYQVLNQYGEDITKTALPNLTFNVSKGTHNANKGELTLSSPSEYKVGDKVVLTVIDSNSAVTANTTLTVAAEAKVSEVTIGDLYNADGKALTEDTIGEDFYLLVEGKDQYGNVVDSVSQLNADLTILASNAAVVDKGDVEEIEIDGKTKFGIKLDPKAKGESLITVISNSNGTSQSQKVTVTEGVKVDTVSIGSPEGIIAGSEQVLIPVEVTNNKGAAVTKVSDIKSTSLDVTNGTGERFIEKDGKLYIQVTTDSVADDTVKNLIVSVTSATNKFSNKVFQVRPNAEAEAIVSLDSAVETAIFEGQTTNLAASDFIVQDQYGRTMESGYTVSAVSADSDKISVGTDGDEITVTANEGSTLVTFTLGGTESTIDVRFTTVAQSEFKSYKVAEVGTVYATADTDYAKALKVYGVTSSGKEVLLPADKYNVVSLNGFTYDVATNKLSGVAGKVDTDANTAKPETFAATAKVVINKTGDELTASGTISAKAPETAKVELREGGVKTGKEKTDVEINDALLNIADFADVLYVEDQYGVAAIVDAANKEVDFKDGATSDDVKLTFTNVVNADNNKDEAPVVAGNGTTTAAIAGLEANDTVDVKITVGGVSKTVKVKVGAKSAEALTAEEAVTAAQQAVTTAQADKDAADAAVTAAQTDKDAADAAVTTAQADKDAADAAVTAAQADKDAADAAVTAAQTDKDAVDADPTATSEDIEAAATALTNAQTAAATAATALTDAQTAAATAATALTDAQTAAATAATALTDAQAAAAAAATALTNAQSALDEAEEELAAL